VKKPRCVVNICLRDLQHEVGNELNVILGFCNLMLRNTSENEKNILSIIKAADNLNNYIQSITAHHECERMKDK
jgi:hypothetical protein